MALINCPHCGRQISDTCGVCIHCGKSIKSLHVGQLKKYFSLPSIDRITLDNEFFYVRNKKYGKVMNKAASLSLYKSASLWTAVILGICAGILTFAVVKTNPAQQNNLLIAMSLPCSFVMAIIFYIVSGILYLRLRKVNKKLIISLKRYQKWLKEEKAIEFNPKFSSSWQSGYYAQINLNEEEF